MRKVLLSTALVFAIAAASSVMVQEEKKEGCSQQKTECVKKCPNAEEKKCVKDAEKKCTKDAEKKCCKDKKQTAGKN